jgi:hypothetical protein
MVSHKYHMLVYLDALNGLKRVAVNSDAGLAVFRPTSDRPRYQHPKGAHVALALIWIICL